MQRTGAVCQKAAAPLKAIGVTVSEESIRAYLEDLNHRGRREETVRFYAAKLKTFYDYLPPDKQIVLNTLETWRQALLAEGYAPATVNTNISAANGLLDYLGRRDLQLTGQLETETAPQSELTRTEYLRLLSAARALEKERTYLLVKAIALTGAHVGELPQITVEAVQSGRTPAVSGGEAAAVSSCQGVCRQSCYPIVAGQGLDGRAGVRHQKQAAPAADTGDGGHPESVWCGPCSAGEVQSPVLAKAVSGHPGRDRPRRAAAGGTGLRPSAGHGAAGRRLG